MVWEILSLPVHTANFSLRRFLVMFHFDFGFYVVFAPFSTNPYEFFTGSVDRANIR